MFRILIVDDQTLWTNLLTNSFAGHSTIQIIGSATTSQQLWSALSVQQPNLVLLDLFLGNEVRDLSLARQIRQLYPAVKLILLTSASQNARLIQEANQLGVDGYLSKDITEDELIRFLHKAEQGERVFSDDVKNVLVRINKEGLPELSPKEKEILIRLDMGMKRAAIISELRIRSANTYDSHVHHMKEKFDVKSTNELLRKAAELGYI